MCFISDPAILSTLQPSPDEVDYIFTHPLKGCHTGILEGEDAIGMAKEGGVWWPHPEELHVSGGSGSRSHD